MRSPEPVPAGDLARLAAGRRLLVIVDFDGTLAPIVPDPPAATILPAARSALEHLAAAGPPGVVIAVLSGRDAADVARRVRVVGPRYIGQHGIEHAHLREDDRGAKEPDAALDPALAVQGEALHRIADQVADRLGRPTWLVVERKGASVGLHYRRASDPDAARRAILAALDGVGGLRASAADETPLVTESRRVVELRPAGAFGKGEAARRLIADVHPDGVLVLGDDRTDAEAFEVVRAWRRTSNRPAMIVGVSGESETPPEVREHADLVVSGPEAAAALLADLATEIERNPPGGGSRGSG